MATDTAAPATATATRKRPARVRLIVALLIALVGVIALALYVFPPGTPGIKSDPPPRLYSDAQLKTLPPMEKARSDGRAFTHGWIQHNGARNDAAFIKDLIASMPNPPDAAATKQELATLHTIRDHHTAGDDAVSRWMEVHAKKQLWKLYLKQHTVFTRDHKQSKVEKAALTDALNLAASAQATAKTHFHRKPPYQQDPSLHSLNGKQFAKKTKFSYPSKHTATAFAAVEILDAIEPHRTTQFEWMALQVAYSRLNGGGHFPSDIVAGAYMGSAIGAYELNYANVDTRDVRF